MWQAADKKAANFSRSFQMNFEAGCGLLSCILERVDLFARIFKPSVNSSKLTSPSTTTESSASFSRQSANKSAKTVTSTRAVGSSSVTIPKTSAALITNHTRLTQDLRLGPMSSSVLSFPMLEHQVHADHRYTNQLGVLSDTDPAFLFATQYITLQRAVVR